MAEPTSSEPETMLTVDRDLALRAFAGNRAPHFTANSHAQSAEHHARLCGEVDLDTPRSADESGCVFRSRRAPIQMSRDPHRPICPIRLPPFSDRPAATAADP